MIKTKTIEYSICDFCLEEGKEIGSAGVIHPSGKDACKIHFDAFVEEVRFPEEFGGEMSGKKIAVDPGYYAQMVVKYKKEK